MSELLPRLKRWLINLHNFISCTNNCKNQVEPELSTYYLIREDSKEKFNNMLRILRRDIKEAFHYVPSDKPLSKRKLVNSCEKVMINLHTLEETIKQAIHMNESLQNGRNIERNLILMKCKTIISIIGGLREDVFQCYLQLSTSEKLALRQKDKHISNIFTVLGMLETEVTKFMRTVMYSDPIMSMKTLINMPSGEPRHRRRMRCSNYFSSDPTSTVVNFEQSEFLPVKKMQNCIFCNAKEVVDAANDPIDFESIHKHGSGDSFYHVTPEISASGPRILDNVQDCMNERYLICPNYENVAPIIDDNIKFNQDFLEKVVETNRLPSVQEEELSSMTIYDKPWNSSENLVNLSNAAFGEVPSDDKDEFIDKSKSLISKTPNIMIKDKTMNCREIETLNQPAKVTKPFKNKLQTHQPSNNNDKKHNIYDLNNSNNTDRAKSLWHESANQLMEKFIQGSASKLS